PVTVTDAPLGTMLAVPVAGATVHSTVRPERALPLASFGVAVMTTDSVSLSNAVLVLSETLLTVGGGGGLVLPPSLLPPQPMAVEQRTMTAHFTKRIRCRSMIEIGPKIKGPYPKCRERSSVAARWRGSTLAYRDTMRRPDRGGGIAQAPPVAYRTKWPPDRRELFPPARWSPRVAGS